MTVSGAPIEPRRDRRDLCPPQHRPAGQRPARPPPPPSPELVALASKRLKTLALVFLVTVLATALPWPARLVVAVLAIATMVLGVRALIRRAAGTPARRRCFAVTAGATVVAGLMAIDVLAASCCGPCRWRRSSARATP